ncbi:DUF2922 domain-containing protein [Clostridium sp. 'White wine YQ']|uniref:DUF2922 domain-containing protein n=1 Tax=Clostridium sp. 'White wine YQ' TaxID=3027474 RepID=UPI002366ADEB|nr:DUF2922 domain-containing protein [Clostridium sp. 'White wine YQ']MDD7794224.1 DUF2922 domain-containing protein [Clostridium sp. 'White wine YQ']
MEYVLSMTFVTSSGDKASFSVTGVKESITEAEVSALMDTIIAKDIFITKSGSYVSKYGAQLTQRQITKYDL